MDPSRNGLLCLVLLVPNELGAVADDAFDKIKEAEGDGASSCEDKMPKGLLESLLIIKNKWIRINKKKRQINLLFRYIQNLKIEYGTVQAGLIVKRKKMKKAGKDIYTM